MSTAATTGDAVPSREGFLRRHRWMVASVAAGALLAGLGWWRSGHVAPPVDGATGGPLADAGWIQSSANGAADASSAQPLRTGLENLPRSLQGTEVDGSVQADANGHLRPDRSVRNLFDYFLALVGEEPLSRVRQRIVAYLRSHLPATAASEAENLLDRYLAYEQARGHQGQGQADGAPPTMSLEAVAQRMAQLTALRQQYFSAAERTAFFGDEEAQDSYTLGRLTVLQDQSLGAVDKAQRLRQLADALPPEMRASLSAQDTYQDLSALTADWKAHGGTAQALHDARVQLVGADATARLEALDQQRAQWAQRVQAFEQQKAAVMADASLSASQRDEAIARLRDSAFTPQERLRLDALVRATANAKP